MRTVRYYTPEGKPRQFTMAHNWELNPLTRLGYAIKEFWDTFFIENCTVHMEFEDGHLVNVDIEDVEPSFTEALARFSKVAFGEASVILWNTEDQI